LDGILYRWVCNFRLLGVLGSEVDDTTVIRNVWSYRQTHTHNNNNNNNKTAKISTAAATIATTTTHRDISVEFILFRHRFQDPRNSCYVLGCIKTRSRLVKTQQIYSILCTVCTVRTITKKRLHVSANFTP
jgi:hypothetical protein